MKETSCDDDDGDNEGQDDDAAHDDDADERVSCTDLWKELQLGQMMMMMVMMMMIYQRRFLSRMCETCCDDDDAGDDGEDADGGDDDDDDDGDRVSFTDLWTELRLGKMMRAMMRIHQIKDSWNTLRTEANSCHDDHTAEGYTLSFLSRSSI